MAEVTTFGVIDMVGLLLLFVGLVLLSSGTLREKKAVPLLTCLLFVWIPPSFLEAWQQCCGRAEQVGRT